VQGVEFIVNEICGLGKQDQFRFFMMGFLLQCVPCSVFG
jgi:hypothetical protein